MPVTKTVITPGTGRAPQPKEVVHCHYVGTLADGTVFDSSRARNKPITFLLGVGSVIKAWDEGIAGMLLGEKATLQCTPDVAYGTEGAPPTIPPNSHLTFEVELVQIGNDKAGGESWCSMM